MTPARDFLKNSNFDGNYTNPPDFVCANVHGNIQLKFKNETSQGLFVTINSVQHLAEVIERAQESRVTMRYHHLKEGWADADPNAPDNISSEDETL